MYTDLEDILPILDAEGHNVKDPWDVVNIFETKIASFVGSKYAVAVDNCTNALFLCLKYFQTFKPDVVQEIVIPEKTYLSVPQSIIHAGYKVIFKDIEWQGSYELTPLPIIDSATRLTKNMYLPDTFCCLSFHKKKMLAIGKGGMILTNDAEAYAWFKLARYQGRHIDTTYDEDDIEMIGWNMYMPPEQAARGIMLFEELLMKYDNGNIPDAGGSWKYKKLTDFTVFKSFA